MRSHFFDRALSFHRPLYCAATKFAPGTSPTSKLSSRPSSAIPVGVFVPNAEMIGAKFSAKSGQPTTVSRLVAFPVFKLKSPLSHGPPFPLSSNVSITDLANVAIENRTKRDASWDRRMEKLLFSDRGDEVWVCRTGTDGISHGDESPQENNPAINSGHLRRKHILPITLRK